MKKTNKKLHLNRINSAVIRKRTKEKAQSKYYRVNGEVRRVCVLVSDIETKSFGFFFVPTRKVLKATHNGNHNGSNTNPSIESCFGQCNNTNDSGYSEYGQYN